jgi:hypothetical protein
MLTGVNLNKRPLAESFVCVQLNEDKQMRFWKTIGVMNRASRGRKGIMSIEKIAWVR